MPLGRGRNLFFLSPHRPLFPFRLRITGTPAAQRADPFPLTSVFRWETRGNPVNQFGARLKLGNCCASDDTASTFLDSRTATEPVISSRLLLPPPRNLHPPLQITRAATHSVPRRTTTVRGGGVQRNGVGGGGGGNQPEPDARLQVQEALTRGSSVRESPAYRRPPQFDGEFRLNRDSPLAW